MAFSRYYSMIINNLQLIRVNGLATKTIWRITMGQVRCTELLQKQLRLTVLDIRTIAG